jgi:hypothetical protein
VAQPPYDPTKPHMVFPEKVYRKILATSDEVVTRTSSYAEPPVPTPAERARGSARN